MGHSKDKTSLKLQSCFGFFICFLILLDIVQYPTYSSVWHFWSVLGPYTIISGVHILLLKHFLSDFRFLSGQK